MLLERRRLASHTYYTNAGVSLGVNATRRAVGDKNNIAFDPVKKYSTFLHIIVAEGLLNSLSADTLWAALGKIFYLHFPNPTLNIFFGHKYYTLYSHLRY